MSEGKINDGGPAFPIPQQQFSDGVMVVSSQGHPGMTLRQWYIGQALAGMAGVTVKACYDELMTVAETKAAIARQAVGIADAVLALEAKP